MVSVSSVRTFRKMKAPDTIALEQSLLEGEAEAFLKIKTKQLKECLKDFRRYFVENALDTADKIYNNFSRYLIESIIDTVEERNELEIFRGDFKRKYHVVDDESERRELVIEFSEYLGATPKQVDGDRQAFSRYFGYDAINERCQKRIFEKNYHILNQLDLLTKSWLKLAQNEPDLIQIWKEQNMEKLISPLITTPGEEKIRQHAIRLISVLCTEKPDMPLEELLSQSTISFVYQLSLRKDVDIWLQIEALELLFHLSENNFISVIENHLNNPTMGDTIFLRHRAAALIVSRIERGHPYDRDLELLMKDPSPYVRQGVVLAFLKYPKHKTTEYFKTILLNDEEDKVRAHCLYHLRELFHSLPTEGIINLLVTCFENEKDALPLQAAMDTLQFLILGFFEAEDIEKLYQKSSPLQKIRTEHPKPPIRMVAAECCEMLYLLKEDAYLKLFREIRPQIKSIKSPGKGSIKATELFKKEEDTTCRLFALCAQRDFPFNLKTGRRKWKVFRGFHFGFRFWRFIYEWREPSTDKRQAYPHDIARKYRGNIHLATNILAELSQTKVPGEPLNIGSENSWRPYLPLVDEMIALLDENRYTKVLKRYTSAGLVECEAPKGFFKRLKAWVSLTFKFPNYAKTRNWQEDANSPPSDYINLFRKLGFQISYKPYHYEGIENGEGEDPKIVRFF